MSTYCRLCGEPLHHLVADLGTTPLANAYLRSDQLHTREPRYPLRAFLCDRCFLLQLDVIVDPEEIFGDYAYFSSYSRTLLHASERYVKGISERLSLHAG